MTTAAEELELDEEMVLPEDQEVEELEGEEEDVILEPEVEEIEEEEEVEVEEEPRQGGMIPKHRYDSAASRAREAERELAELKASMEPVVEKEVKADPYTDLDLRLEQARADGEIQTAADINREIRDLERSEREAELDSRSRQTSENTRESIRLDDTISSINTQHPSLDAESDTYDQSTVDEVIRLQHAFVSTGASPTEALKDAVGYVMGSAVVEDTKAPAAKRTTDVKRNVDTEQKQPPELDKVGFDSDSTGKKESIPNVMELSEEEFDALPEATKRKMRGDVS